MSEAAELGHDMVGTDHVLLGLIRDRRDLGARALSDAGITIDAAREQVMRLHREGVTDDGEPAGGARVASTPLNMLDLGPATTLRQLVARHDVAAVFAKHRIDVERLLNDLRDLE
jgi:ATP-dependent Clp protease ATP-binding subunit ClpA